jgi:hypothetical protein
LKPPHKLKAKSQSIKLLYGSGNSNINKWLQGFAYRTPVNWWMFGIAGIATMVIALLTVSSQAIRASVMNPVKSLRTE